MAEPQASIATIATFGRIKKKTRTEPLRAFMNNTKINARSVASYCSMACGMDRDESKFFPSFFGAPGWIVDVSPVHTHTNT